MGESCPKNNNCTYPKCLIEETMSKAREFIESKYGHNNWWNYPPSKETVAEWMEEYAQQETEALQKRVCELEFNLKQLHSRLELLILTERVNINLQETVRDLNIAEQLLKQGN